MPEWTIRLLETPEEMIAVEALQRLVWSGSETEILPAHMLLAANHNGGLTIGAFVEEQMVGFVFGFPGFYATLDGPRPKHCSHMLGVISGWRGRGLGFALKRAQWQMVRHQGIDRVTWTYDPLLSNNACLNISKLGAVCNTYLQNEYGEMRDQLNVGLPTDRFQVDWWVFTQRVERKLGRRARSRLRLGEYLSAKAQLRCALPGSEVWPIPSEEPFSMQGKLLLVEIPSQFLALKAADPSLAQDWRFCTRRWFEIAFSSGYLVTDFVYDDSAASPRSYYVLVHGESVLYDV